MAKTLDRSRPHGTVHPPYKGAHFEQDGFSFDAQGALVEALLTAEQKAALARKAAPRAPQPQQASGTPKPPRPEANAGAEDEGKPGEGSEGEVNLEQWLRDDKSANFLEVRKAIKDRYSVWETTKAGALAFLVHEQKLIGEEELDPDLRAILQARDKAGP